MAGFGKDNAFVGDVKFIQQSVEKFYNVNHVKARKLIIVTRNALGNNTKFTFPINIFFTPDEMIVRSITYNQNAGTNNIWHIYSDINNEIMGSFGSATASSVSTTPNNTFNLQKPIQGTYTFQLYDTTNPNNLVTPPDASGNLSISLEFVKYA